MKSVHRSEAQVSSSGVHLDDRSLLCEKCKILVDRVRKVLEAIQFGSLVKLKSLPSKRCTNGLTQSPYGLNRPAPFRISIATDNSLERL